MASTRATSRHQPRAIVPRKRAKSARSVFGRSREWHANQILHRLQAPDATPDTVLRIARVALPRYYTSRSVYKPVWLRPLKKLFGLPSSRALASWWLESDADRNQPIRANTGRAYTNYYV